MVAKEVHGEGRMGMTRDQLYYTMFLIWWKLVMDEKPLTKREWRIYQYGNASLTGDCRLRRG